MKVHDLDQTVIVGVGAHAQYPAQAVVGIGKVQLGVEPLRHERLLQQTKLAKWIDRRSQIDVQRACQR